jgi:anti-sigma regulatory factor (Ser/Thr protein kinase)
LPSQLVCRPEQGLPVGILRVTGELDPMTSDALGRAVGRLLALQPTAVLVDIAGLVIREASALHVLDEVACATAEWPDVPIVLCGADPAVTAGLSCESISRAESCAEALAAIGEEPEPRRIRARLRPVPDACRQVRQLVNQACATWQRRDAAATAALIATELVANVVRHAHTTMEFTMALRDGRMCLAVRDGSHRLPRPADPTLKDAGGRGLRLVRELTESWGVLPVTDGKVVWTHLGVA